MADLNLKQSIVNLMESLTIHGLPKIIRSKFKILKLWWLTLTLISISLAILFIRQTLIEYFRYNVITEVCIVDVSEIEFPTITICKVQQVIIFSFFKLRAYNLNF